MKRGGMSSFAAGAIALVVIALGTYLGFAKSVPLRHHFQIAALFASANGIRPGAPVRIAGVDVGKVTALEPVAGHLTRVTMRVDARGLPIHADARLKIRPRIFLEGNFFVDVEPGTPRAPVLGDGDIVGVAQTSTPVQLDQVLTALQGDTRARLRDLLRAYGSGLAGAGARGYNRSLRYWARAYRSAAVVNTALLGERTHDLSAYVGGAGRVADALDRQPAQLQSLIADLDTTAAALARRQDALEQTVAELPRTLRAAQPALARLNASFPPLRRLIADLRPAVRSSAPALAALEPFLVQARGLVSAPDLRGLVSDLRPTVPALARLDARSVGLLARVRAASSCQNEVILPWSRQEVPDPAFPPHGKVFQEAVKFLPGLAGESRSGDANGQWISALGANGTFTYALGSGFGQTTFPLLGTQPPASDRPPNNQHAPCERQAVPDLRVHAGPPPRRVHTDGTSARARARYRLAYARVTEWLRAALLRAGHGDRARSIAPLARARARALTPAQLRVLRRDMRRAGVGRP